MANKQVKVVGAAEIAVNCVHKIGHKILIDAAHQVVSIEIKKDNKKISYSPVINGEDTELSLVMFLDGKRKVAKLPINIILKDNKGFQHKGEIVYKE